MNNMINMNKQDEIALLKDTAKKLKDGYTGRIINTILPYIIRCIENDHPVAMGMQECRNELKRMYDAIESSKNILRQLNEEIAKREIARRQVIAKLEEINKVIGKM